MLTATLAVTLVVMLDLVVARGGCGDLGRFTDRRRQPCDHGRDGSPVRRRVRCDHRPHHGRPGHRHGTGGHDLRRPLQRLRHRRHDEPGDQPTLHRRHEYGRRTVGVPYSLATAPDTITVFTTSDQVPVSGGPVQATSTVLVSSVNPSVVGQSVSFTATVSGRQLGGGGGVPSGTVEFFDGGTPIGCAHLITRAKATFKTSSLSVGSHKITAVYSGDSRLSRSISSS